MSDSSIEISPYEELIRRSGHTRESISEARRSYYEENGYLSDPWRIVLYAKLGATHTIDGSSEWATACFASWLLFDQDVQKHRAFWLPVTETLKQELRGFEPSSGMDFLESICEYALRCFDETR